MWLSLMVLVQGLLVLTWGRGFLCCSLSDMKLLEILSSLMMDDTYKGRGKYHSKVRRFHLHTCRLNS